MVVLHSLFGAPEITLMNVIMGGEPELDASKEVCDEVYESFLSTKYGSCSNFWGNSTQPNQVYGNASYCEKNYNFTEIFYKGHSIGAYCSYENCELGEHWALYSDRGYGAEYILDCRKLNRNSG